MIPHSKKLHWSALTMLVVFAISISSCRKDNNEECCDPTDPECPNYDPCFGVEEPSAEFFIEDQAWDAFENEPIFVPQQDLLVGYDIRFRSEYQNPEYTHTWYIGVDTFPNPSVVVDFSDVSRPNTITVSHVIEYPVDSTCYPLSSGRDSVSRTFDLMHYWDELPTVGNTFRGVLEGQTDSFDFRLKMHLPDGSIPQWGDSFAEIGFYRVNWHNDGDSVQMADSFTATEHYLSKRGSLPIGNLVIDSNTNEVLFEYRWLSTEEFVFKGRVLD
ncbi:hypothetical protein [Halocola ammonii]